MGMTPLQAAIHKVAKRAAEKEAQPEPSDVRVLSQDPKAVAEAEETLRRYQDRKTKQTGRTRR
jgi:hypothetical protein